MSRGTHSDCFIGLDVSHEDGKSAAGIMNVIGSNGHLIKQSAINGSLAGEIIDAAVLKEIVIDVLHAYHHLFGVYPKHVTIHLRSNIPFPTKLFFAMVAGERIRSSLNSC